MIPTKITFSLGIWERSLNILTIISPGEQTFTTRADRSLEAPSDMIFFLYSTKPVRINIKIITICSSTTKLFIFFFLFHVLRVSNSFVFMQA